MEQWKAIPGYEGLYEVSNTGKVRSLTRYKRELNRHLHKQGYEYVQLTKDHETKNKLVHRLVAMAYINNPNNYPQVNHIDEDKTNNNVNNLEWCTAKYNMNYGKGAKARHIKIDYSKPIFKENAVKNGKKTSRAIVQFTKDGVFVARYDSAKEAMRKLGVKNAHITEVAKGKRPSANGFVWRYERSEDLSAYQF